MIKIELNQKCPINDKISITSKLCKSCKNYINHKNIYDEHGRIEHHLIDCKILNN